MTATSLSVPCPPVPDLAATVQADRTTGLMRVLPLVAWTSQVIRSFWLASLSLPGFVRICA